MIRLLLALYLPMAPVALPPEPPSLEPLVSVWDGLPPDVLNPWLR